MALRRIDLKRLISQRADDFWTATVDAPVIGAAGYTTVNSHLLLQNDAQFWFDHDVTFAYSGGTYDTRRVVEYVPTVSGLTGGVVRVDATLSLIPSTNTDIYIYRKWKVAQYNDAINQAIRHAGEQGLVECMHTNNSLVATARIWEYSVPSSSVIDRITDVFYLDQSNYDEKRRLDRRSWDFRRVSGALTLILRNDSLIPASYSIWLEGPGPPLTLETDGATLDAEVPGEYVVDYALGELRLSKWSGNDPEDSARQATFLKQMAEAKLRSAQKFVPRGRLRRHW